MSLGVKGLMLLILRNMRTVTHISHTIRTVIVHRAYHNVQDACNNAHQYCRQAQHSADFLQQNYVTVAPNVVNKTANVHDFRFVIITDQ
jgi:hypothetical protein